MKWTAVFLFTIPVAACTFIVGSHNTSDRQGPCGAVIWSKCDDSGTTVTNQDKVRTNKEGDKPSKTELVVKKSTTEGA